MMRAKYRRLVAAGLLLCSLAVINTGVLADDKAAPADKAAPTVEQLEAALLVTFANYTVWPAAALPSAVTPIVVGVVGDQALAQTFEGLSRERRASGRPFVTKVLQWESDISGVHLLFLGPIDRRHMTAILARSQQAPMLTVSMASDFGGAGGMISLKSTGGRVSFAVNARAVHAAGLQLSSFVLSYATSVSNR